MKKQNFLILLFLLFAVYSSGKRPDLMWAKAILGSDDINIACVKVDNRGDIVVAGTFEGTADFNPGTAVYNLTSADGWGSFMLKLNSNGDFIWAKHIVGINSARLHDMDIDKNNNIVITGYSGKDVDFDPGTGVVSPTNNGASDIYVAKYDVNGNFLWVGTFGGEVSDDGTSVTVDSEGNILVTGWFQGTVDFNPGAEKYELTSWGVDCFIVKLTSTGAFSWAKMITSKSPIEGHNIKTDAVNNIYIAGKFNRETDFDPGEGIFNMTPYANNAAFLLKLDKNGKFKWAIQPGGTTLSKNYGLKRPIAIDNNGNVILAFRFSGSVDFDPGLEQTILTSKGSEDIFIQKIDSLGKLVWVKQIGGINADEAWGVTTDKSGNIYVTGFFHGTVDFDPGEGSYLLNSDDNWVPSPFVAKYDKNGNSIWAYHIVREQGNWPYGFGNELTVDASGNVLAVGDFNGKYDFNAGRAPLVFASPEDKYSGFVIKLSGVISKTNEIGESRNIRIYPNPVTDRVQINSGNPFYQATVNIFTLSGQKLLTLDNQSGSNIVIDLSKLSAGMYVVEVSDKNNQIVSKIIKR